MRARLKQRRFGAFICQVVYNGLQSPAAHFVAEVARQSRGLSPAIPYFAMPESAGRFEALDIYAFTDGSATPRPQSAQKVDIELRDDCRERTASR